MQVWRLLELRPAAKDAILAAVSHPKYKLRWVAPQSKEEVTSMFVAAVTSSAAANCNTTAQEPSSAVPLLLRMMTTTDTILQVSSSGGSRNFHLGRPVKGQANFGWANRSGVRGDHGVTRAVWIGQARVWVGHGLPSLIARTASEVDFPENHYCCHQMLYFKAKMHEI